MGSNQPEPKASVTLPPEILDDILDHIPANTNGRPTLVACALVATWWIGPSQRRLFSSVKVHYENYWDWTNCVARESNTHLLRYVHSLVYCPLDPLYGTRFPMRNILRDARKYLPSLHNLERLSLFNITINCLDQGGLHACFSRFRETLTRFSLRDVVVSFSMFVTLVGHFPNITTLRLGILTPRADEGPVPSLPWPLRGKIHLEDIDSRRFIERLAGLDLEYDGLTIESRSLVAAGDLENMLQLSANTIKYLRLNATLEDEISVRVSHLRQLRELDLFVNWSSSAYKGIFSSITSTEFRKIIFPVDPEPHWNIFLQESDTWASLDKELCDLVDRMRYGHKLEVEFRPTEARCTIHEYDLTQFLPEFSKEGIVTVRDDDPDWNP